MPKEAVNLYDVAQDTAKRILRGCPAPQIFGATHCGKDFTPYRHLRFIGSAIARAIARGSGRLIVNLGPQYGKSYLLSQITPAWFLEKWPEKRVIVCAYGDELADMSGRWVRNFFDQSSTCQTRLRPDSTAADRWNTTEGGGMKTAGVGGAITGFGADLIIVDDPYKDVQDAHSPTYNQQLREWWNGVLLNRCAANATIVVCHHRWTDEDLTGWLLSEQNNPPWEHIRLPSLAEADDPLGRKPGEPLCPAMHPLSQVLQFRSAQGPFFDSLQQQNPRPIGKGVVYHRFGQYNLNPRAELRTDLPLALCLDFNINPGMHALVAQYDSKSDLFTFREEFHGPRMDLMACMQSFGAWIKLVGGWKWPELHVFGDASGVGVNVQTGESHWDTVRAHLTRMGVPFRLKVPKSNPSVVSRIMTVNDALQDIDGKAHVHVHPNCVRLLTDFRTLKSNDAGTTNKSDEKLSHASEAGGYMIDFLRPVGGPIQIPRGRFSVAVN